MFRRYLSLAGRAALQCLSPSQCALCGLNAAAALCADCLAELPAPPARCRCCAAPMPAPAVCGRCLQQPPPFRRTHARFDYAFPLDALLARFKYHGDLTLLPALSLLAGTLAPLLRDARGLLVPVALHAARERERGFNQSLLLARPLAAATELRLAPGLVRRSRATPPQTTLSAAQRHDNLRGAFICDADLAGLRVWLFDDVMTTGATLAAASSALLTAGASSVDAVVLARSRASPPGSSAQPP